MMILLSCAKTMSTNSRVNVPYTTTPQFLKQADIIAIQMSQCSIEELEQLLHVNPKIAVENFKRYQEFHSTDSKSVLPSLFAYTGIVFKRLNPKDLTSDELSYAQSHLRLTSFCYGLLRPLDLIHLYRLEGNVKLPDFNGSSLFVYWQSLLTDLFIDDIKKAGGVLCNLASDEMKGLFDWSKIESSVEIVTPDFSVIKNGKRSTVVVYTKMMRGEMARFILKNKIINPEQLINFECEGFRYDEKYSSKSNPVFTLLA